MHFVLKNAKFPPLFLLFVENLIYCNMLAEKQAH